MLVIVPDSLRDEIHRRLTEAYKECPEGEAEREVHYQQLLAFYNQTSKLPENFKIGKTPEKA